MWVQLPLRAMCTTLCDKVTCDRSVFSPGPPVSSTNKTDCHDITEILLKMALSTIKQANKQKHFKVKPFLIVIIVQQKQN
jgi:hypothetical protein